MKQWILTKKFNREERFTIITLYPHKLVSGGEGVKVNRPEYLDIKMMFVSNLNGNMDIEIHNVYSGSKTDGRQYWHLLTECGFEDESD